MPRKPAKEYKEGDPIPEGYLVAKKTDPTGADDGTLILRKKPKSGTARKNHVHHLPDGGWKKTQSQMKNFYEGRFGVPATRTGRPRKNKMWITEKNPHAAGKMLKYTEPSKLAYAFDVAIAKLATKDVALTKNAVLLEAGMAVSVFDRYKDKDGYKVVCEQLEMLCESYLQDEAILQRNPNAVSLLKMYHDRSEKQSIEVSSKSPVSELTDDQLTELAKQAIDITPNEQKSTRSRRTSS